MIGLRDRDRDRERVRLVPSTMIGAPVGGGTGKMVLGCIGGN